MCISQPIDGRLVICVDKVVNMLLEWIVVLVLNKLFEGKDPRELYGYHLGRALSFLMPCYFGPCLSLFHRAY